MKAARVALVLAVASALAAGAGTPRRDLAARAKAGDPVAMRELAYDLHVGLDGRRNAKGAQRWARAAIDRGDVQAELVLAWILARGERGRLGDAACFWFLSAKHQGLDDATLEAADCLASAASGPELAARAREWYEQALARGETEARMRLFQLYDRAWYGVSTTIQAERIATARRYLVAAAEAGEVEAMKRLARELHQQPAPNRDLAGAVRWYERAFAAGDVASGVELGALLYEGPGVSAPERAVPVLRAVAERGQARAMRYLGRAYAEGRGIERDPVEAQRWFLAAGRLRDGEGALRRAQHHLEPANGEYSPRRARYWLEIAARADADGAARQLGLMHLRGDGVEPDLRKGMRLLAQAAYDEDVEAARIVIRLRLDGRLVRREVREAVGVATRNAERLDAASCARIGELFLTGDGVERDPATARRWLTVAAERGDARAMALVHPMYADGFGGPPDAEAAQRWRDGALAAGVAVDEAWRPAAANRAAARAEGRSLAHLSWGADLDWGARDTIAIRELPSRGALRASFSVTGIQPKLRLIGQAGVEVAHGADETLGVYMRLLPLDNPESRREVTRSEFVLERRAGSDVVSREVIAHDRWTVSPKWIEVSWDESGAVVVRLEGRPPLRLADGVFRVREARGVIDSVEAQFHYLVVD